MKKKFSYVKKKTRTFSSLTSFFPSQGQLEEKKILQNAHFFFSHTYPYYPKPRYGKKKKNNKGAYTTHFSFFLFFIRNSYTLY